MYFMEAYRLPWLMLAILSWITIYFTCSYKQFTKALPAAIWTMIVGAILEQFFLHHKFWSDKYLLIPIGELDLFLVIGPFFTLGLLLIRLLPRNKWGILSSVLFFSILATGIEVISIKLSFLKYHETKWNYLHSIFAYSLGLMSTLGFHYALWKKR